MERWFHKKDGGLIKPKNQPEAHLFGFSDAYCSVCEACWYFYGFDKEKTAGGRIPDWVHFSDLPEDLQSVALAEML